MSSREERKRSEHHQRAYDVQYYGGVQGAVRWTIYGALACTIAHFTWPLFRRQTLALKGFLTSSATIYGMVAGADNNLIRYESDLRRTENHARQRARASLARDGKIPSEAEIRQWRDEELRQLHPKS